MTTAGRVRDVPAGREPAARARRPRRVARLGALGAVLASVLLAAACTSTGTTTTGTTSGAGSSPATAAGPSVTWTDATTDVDGAPVHTSCAGSGDVTVVFIAAVGETGDEAWVRGGVPEQLAGDARVCVYDRPGLGRSAPTVALRTVETHAAELAVLVRAGAIPPPLVLVGHGYGTFIARWYAKEQRRDVAGMVLVDPPLEPLDPTPPAGASPGVAAELAGLEHLNANLGSYGAGALPPPPAPTIVLGVDDRPPLPPDAPAGAPTTRPASPAGGGAPATVDPRERRLGQEQLANKGPFGSYRLVEGSGSYVQYWAPDALVDAVRTVLADRR